MTLDEMKEQIVTELNAELTEDGEALDETALKLLESKVKGAIREVKEMRRYPLAFKAEDIASDMERYYSNVKNIALYDYNHIGIEFQTGSSENGISRTFPERKTLFNGILPRAKIL